MNDVLEELRKIRELVEELKIDQSESANRHDIAEMINESLDECFGIINDMID